jgi:hypothetical protein
MVSSSAEEEDEEDSCDTDGRIRFLLLDERLLISISTLITSVASVSPERSSSSMVSSSAEEEDEEDSCDTDGVSKTSASLCM